MTDGGASPDGGAGPGCDLDGFTAADGDYLTTGLGDFVLLYDGDTAPVRKVQLELYTGSRSPFVHAFTGENFATCSVCLSLLDDCDGTQGDCTVQYLAQSGTVELTAYNDTAAEGTFTGVTAIEVTIDPNTFESTPVPGGQGWCLDTLAFATVVSGG